ncbi:MAG: SET domain-containing protein, partial [Hymenobacteraceae bacterium]|nr:SET domain-containing protein [Hymenobacteraceae bacterium]MDX5397855.1 SET domain-containing protein [Hymenobacteraceae bacterium]MDX5513927.1 SET domain-containing protein [Hymenobacteraceae bacterium]
MMHPDTELKFISPEIGYGVVATKFIPKGTITWIADPLDHVFTPKEVQQLEPDFQAILNKYTYRDNKGNLVLCWDNARFVNHSFNSNCISTAYNFELAIRDIQPGEELTDDYGYLNVQEPFEALPEPGTTRTKVMPDDLLHYHEEWDEKLKQAFRNYIQVAQPLAKYIAPVYQYKVQQIAVGKAEM